MASYLWPGRADDTYVRASFQTQDRSSGEGIRLRVVDKLGVSTAVCVRKRCLVRAEGLEPSRTLRSNGFSYPATAFAATHRFRNGVWGLDYPFTVPGLVPGVRCCPSSLYTFPAVSGRAWLGIAMLQGSPNLSSSASPI